MDYTLQQVARICGGELTGPDHPVRAVMTDSRNLPAASGAVFAALRGANHDGHAYIRELYDTGVRAFIVEREPSGDFPGAGFVTVPDSLAALQQWAAHHRQNYKGTVVAVTGSNGKTIVKEWISQLAPGDARMFRSPRSYNSQLGVALSLLMIAGDERFAVIEAGISQPGEMARLEAMIRPDIGVITNIGGAHQENFSSIDEKLDEKLSLFRGARAIVYHSTMPLVARKIKALFPDKELFSIGPAAGDRVRTASPSEIVFNGNQYNYTLKYAGQAAAENLLSCLGLYAAMGYDLTEIAAKVPALSSVAMRLEVKEGVHGSVLIDDSYNSDINSLSIALESLGSVAGNRKKVLIISDILQSGYAPGAICARIASLAGEKGVGMVVGIGETLAAHSAAFGPGSHFYLTAEEFLHAFDRKLLADSAVLIKGSRVFRFEKISHALENKVHTTILEVDLDAMIHNLNFHRARLAPGVKTMAMVKASSYGTGSAEIAAMLQHQKVDCLAVAFADEGVALRGAGITLPIVVLNADSWSFASMIENRLEPEIYNFASLEMFMAEVRHYGEALYPVHLKIDTGMHRLGFMPGQIETLVARLSGQKQVRVASVFSHLAASDMPEHDGFVEQQIETFRQASGKIVDAFGGQNILRHIANSAAIERFPQAQFDMVRLGIGLYGSSPVGAQGLMPVATLKSRIVQVKELAAGETVGYCRNGKITRPSRTATVPVGYADGLDRRLGNGAWQVMVNGTLSPTIGNICMDTCMIDVTGIDAREGDTVVFFGAEPSIELMAGTLGTIPYEILTSVSARVKRIYLKE